MDRVVFLNSSGGIVGLYDNSYYIPSLHIAPYFETVMLPVVSVDSSAIYGDHPESLATVTYSSGAALTFFCDSVAGGNDSSGDGSFDNPWRSLRTASRFLACASCTLFAAAPYIQLKVRGTVDYLSSYWHPVGFYWRLIIAGWGERCDLGTQTFFAGYFFNVRTRGGYAYGPTVYSNCTLVDAGGGYQQHIAVNCDIVSGAYLSCAYNCSGAALSGAYLSASAIYGGSFGHSATAHYVYSAAITASRVDGYVSMTALYVSRAAVSAVVTAAGTATDYSARVVGIGARDSSYLAGCSATAIASVHAAGSDGFATAEMIGSPGVSRVVSGGVFRASAAARVPDAPGSVASADATVRGFDPSDALAGVQTVFSVTASAHLAAADGDEREYETIKSGGTTCVSSRVRLYSSGVMTSSYAGTSCWPWY